MAKTQAKAVTFFSKYTELQIVMVHDTKMLIDNHQLFTSPSRVLQFHAGTLTTSDQEVIDFLMNRPAYGIDYFSSEDARAEFSNPEINPVTGDAIPEVSRPKRTKAGQRAAVAAKPTTAEDVDADAGEASASEGAESEDAE